MMIPRFLPSKETTTTAPLAEPSTGPVVLSDEVIETLVERFDTVRYRTFH